MAQASIIVPAAAAVGAILIVGLSAGPTGGANEPPLGIRGFSARAAAVERDLEKRYRAIPSPEEARGWHRRFTSVPHPATSKANNEHGPVHRRAVEGAGPRGRRHPPLRRAVVEPARGAGRDGGARALRADAARGSATQKIPDTAQPDISGAWLSFSASGDVTAPVVYANSGNPADYDVLRQNGIDPRGQDRHRPLLEPLQLSRLQGADRRARGRGRDDRLLGSGRGRLRAGRGLPEGPLGPGEPPPARRHRLRLHRPRRSADAGLGVDARRAAHPDRGRRVGAEGDGACRCRIATSSRSSRSSAVRRRPRSGRARCRSRTASAARPRRCTCKVDMQTDVQPNYVVEGRIRGSERPDEWVVLGNHHDAWVFGGVDPVERHGGDDGADPGARAAQAARRAARGARSSSAAGTARRSRSPARPNGASSSPTSCSRRPSPTSTSTPSASGPAARRVAPWARSAPMIVELTKELARPVGHARSTRPGRRPEDEAGTGERRAARPGAGHHADRQRLGPHGVHQLPRRCRSSRWASTAPTASTTRPTTDHYWVTPHRRSRLQVPRR